MKSIFTCLCLMATLASSGAWAAETDLYSRVQAIWETGGMPNSKDLNAETIWVGKCVASNDRMKRTNGSIFFHVEQDPILGGIFSMIPLTHIGDESLDFDTLLEKSYEIINSNRVITNVGLFPEERAWTARIKSRDNETRTVYLRQFKQASGRPAFAMRLFERYAPDQYCYLYDEKSAGNKGGPVAPPGEPVPAPEP